MDVVVKGRRGIEVPQHFRSHVSEKLARVERLDQFVSRIEVEISHEPNPRQADICQRVEITCRTRGPVLRAEACAADFYAAVDTATGRLESRLRRLADRRRDHADVRGHRRRVGLADVPVDPVPLQAAAGAMAAGTARTDEAEGDLLVADRPGAGDEEPTDRHQHLPDGDVSEHIVDGTLVVREKVHRAEPMSLQQALFEMELVGHDFFLFTDADSGQPSVAYRRRGYDYGVIRLGG